MSFAKKGVVIFIAQCEKRIVTRMHRVGHLKKM